MKYRIRVITFSESNSKAYYKIQEKRWFSWKEISGWWSSKHSALDVLDELNEYNK